MKNKFLIFALFCQFLLISAMFIKGFLPVFLGTEIKVQASTYDPRDLLLGDYVWLDYGVRLDENLSFASSHSAKLLDFRAKSVYISLEDTNQDGIYEFSTQSVQRPDTLFIEAKPLGYGSQVILGIEKYFVPKNKALELEKELLSGKKAIVTLKIYEGKARIIHLNLAKP